MKGFAIIVDFTVKVGRMAAFRTLVEANARASCRDEPGCRRFDVLNPTDGQDPIVLYEIYDDRAAFDAHLASPHYATFNQDGARYVAAKTICEFKLFCEGSA
jgi:(4S)-4-hydroxy-5-phosphonooxypentane-2,3-dione isomerase